MAELAYEADGATIEAFFEDVGFVRGLRGPVGSGKSVACCIELFRRAWEQAPSPLDGVRKTRWAVVRNTQPQLRTTTIKTWLDWFPERQFGKMNWSPPFTHRIRRGEIDAEVIFLALDKAEDVKKLLSLELTGAFINEAREVPKSVVDAVTMRVGRYPSQRDGGPSWSGVFMDTNAPDEDHWWAIMSGDCPPPDWMPAEEVSQLVKPQNWSFLSQPAAMLPVKREGRVIGYGMNGARENQKGVPDSYYQQMVTGKSHAWIDVYIRNQYGTLADGKPVYPDFDKALHVAEKPLKHIPGIEVQVGIDFGLTPAAIFGQKVRGRWLILRELVAVDMGMVRFARLIKETLAELGGDATLTGDPTGDSRVGTDEDTPYRVLRRENLNIRPASSNDPSLRIEAVTTLLTRLVDRKPGVIIDPRCKVLIAGFESGYHYKRLMVSGNERYEDRPDKNRFSHPHDALQYLALGGGEGRALVHGLAPLAPVVASRRFDVFQRKALKKKVALKRW